MKFFLPLFLLLSIFYSENIFSQELHLNIAGKKMSDFSKLENKLKSKIYETDGDIVIPSGMAMPIMYRREQKNIPDLIVTYTFTEKDSLIYQIHYSWDPRNFEKGEAKTQSLTFDKLLIEKYNKLLASLISKYGISESKGELIDLQKIESNMGLRQSDSWITKDLDKIDMSIIMSNNYKFNGSGRGLPLHILNIYVNHQRK